jgi:hypothetical protein
MVYIMNRGQGNIRKEKEGYLIFSQATKYIYIRKTDQLLTGMKIASVPVLLLCLTTLLFLVILLSLTLSAVSKQHNPFLPTTYEFTVVAKRSGRVAVFFVFNVIVITIFRGSSVLKPSTEDSEWFLSSFPHFVVYEAADGAKAEATWEDHEYYSCSDTEDGDEYDHGYDGYEEDNDDDGDGSDYDVDSEDDKDLERRIEEFIAKNYKQRREELIYM